MAEGTLGLTIDRVVGEGVHEHLDLANYSQQPVRLNLEIVVRARAWETHLALQGNDGARPAPGAVRGSA